MLRDTLRDAQQNRAYDWERMYIAKHDVQKVPFNQIKFVVDYMWKGEGLEHPPIVSPLPKPYGNVEADSTRLELRFKPFTNTWVIIHELAHSMTSMATGLSNYHGELWLGRYMQLLYKYLKIPMDYLQSTALQSGLRFDCNPPKAVWLSLESTVVMAVNDAILSTVSPE